MEPTPAHSAVFETPPRARGFLPRSETPTKHPATIAAPSLSLARSLADNAHQFHCRSRSRRRSWSESRARLHVTLVARVRSPRASVSCSFPRATRHRPSGHPSSALLPTTTSIALGAWRSTTVSRVVRDAPAFRARTFRLWLLRFVVAPRSRRLLASSSRLSPSSRWPRRAYRGRRRVLVTASSRRPNPRRRRRRARG